MIRIKGRGFIQSNLVEYLRPGRSAAKALHLGIDIGSVSCKLALLDDDMNIRYLRYERTCGRAMETARRLLSELFEKVPPDRIASMVGTGSAGRALCELLDIDFVNELICQSAAISYLQPDVRTLIEMGGQDSKIIFLGDPNNPENATGSADMVDFAMNTNCAAGTGSFLDQQASRLGVDIEAEFGKLALKSETPPRVAGRCSVFAKSDMIHLQQQATPVHDIVAGLCLGLARNLKSTLCRGKEIVRPVAFCGGVAANAGVARAIEEVFELGTGGLIIPAEHAVTGAIGASIVQMRQGAGAGSLQEPRVVLSELDKYIRQGRKIGHRLKPISQPSHPAPASRVYAELIDKARAEGTKIPAYLGIDVGSISTNVVAMDEHKRILSKAYLMTAGRPLEAVRKGLEIVGSEAQGQLEILGAATTGSGRYLTGDFVGADLVINEITAQATGAAIVDPGVDTIFEIGGQDSKFISLEEGVVVDFEMNHACAAGTGSFLEEQAERLGMSIKGEFADDAFTSQAPVRLGERCTVFMESDLLSYQQQGAERCDLVAGLAYSIVTNYLNRVVGHRRIGQRIFFQGGTAFNRAVTAAFEAVTGKDVVVPDHHEVTGALGAAELARRHMTELAQNEADVANVKSKFRGFDLSRLEYEIRSFECRHCANNCEIKEVLLPDSDPLHYGSRCDRYNLKKGREKSQDLPDLFDQRRRMLEHFARQGPKSPGRKTKRTPRGTIGIPMCLSNYQLLPMWGTFFDELGFDVVLSGKTTKALIQAGAEATLSQACFPVKVAHGHVLKLVEKGADFIWLPSIVSMSADYPANKSNQLCPYVQTIPYQMKAVLLTKGIDPAGRKNRLIDLHLRFENIRQLRCTLRPLAGILNVTRTQINRALAVATGAQASFEQACRQRGREVLDSLDAARQACVIVSRPYNGCDPGVSLDLPRKLRQMNILAIPTDFLDLAEANITEPQLQSQMYWKYGQNIFRAAHIIRQEPRLNAIYLSNFSCGPDSFIISMFKELMTSVDQSGAEFRKPALVIEIDEHSADAGVITRLEAFHESLKATRRRRDKATARQQSSSPWRRQWGNCLDRTLYMPWMGDGSYAVAAAFRYCGQPAEVLPISDEETLRRGRKYTSGRECLPCILTAGDMLRKVTSTGFDPSKGAFFMPGTNGPCRFGQYNCLQRLILKHVGMSDEVMIVAPNQDTSFYDEMRRFRKDPSLLAFIGISAIDLLYKMLHRTRPYEQHKGQTDQIYRECLDRIVAAIEAGCTQKEMVKQMGICGSRFAGIPLNSGQRRPVIAVVGEIYIRNHVFANHDVIRQLEELGAEVNLAGINEWLCYTSLIRKIKSRRLGASKSYLENLVKGYFQHKIEKRLAGPLSKHFGSLADSDVREIIKLASPYLHISFQGEAILSIGKIVEMYRQGAGGALSIGPFTCMPSNIVSSLTRRLSSDCGGLPILSISYDGQQDPTLQTRLEAFVHQVHNFRPQKVETPAIL
ncbi:MAG: acyl-CoA dehydratase activase [Planctomycetota bacterium]|jgi:predicted CoA-substrate-specific enzyme activase